MSAIRMSLCAVLLLLATVAESAKPFRKTASLVNPDESAILVADAGGRPVAYERQQLDEWSRNPDIERMIEVNGARLHPSAVNKFRQLLAKADDRKARLNALRQWLATMNVNTDQ